jgi:hypothetical protein
MVASVADPEIVGRIETIGTGLKTTKIGNIIIFFELTSIINV